MKQKICVVVVLTLAFVCQVSANLHVTPVNIAVVAGQTATIPCATSIPTPTARVIWTEFASNALGSPISDNRNIVPTHPSAARFSVVGSNLTHEFHIEIRDVRTTDGGVYMCQNINNGPPDVFRAYAQLVVLVSEPQCQDYTTGNGNVIEGYDYTAECELLYSGNIVPVLTWTGEEGSFYTNGTRGPGRVWSYLHFTANRIMENFSFQHRTEFTDVINPPPGYAGNAPEYQHTFEGVNLVVNWPPLAVTIDNIKPVYEVGETLTCFADSKPISSYQWTNTRENQLLPPGPSFTITEDFRGHSTVMRCQASMLVDLGFFSADGNVTVNVPALTSPIITVPTTTTAPPAVSSCNNPTGRWSATNPVATVCIDVDSRGNIFTLIRNGSETFFGTGRGKTDLPNYDHIAFTTIWPTTGGTAGFCGECHRCLGNEVLLMSGLARDKSNSAECGASAGTQLTNLYVFTRSALTCVGMTVDEVRTTQPWILDKMGIKAKKIITE